jgi:hypothetical protein
LGRWAMGWENRGQKGHFPEKWDLLKVIHTTFSSGLQNCLLGVEDARGRCGAANLGNKEVVGGAAGAGRAENLGCNGERQ